MPSQRLLKLHACYVNSTTWMHVAICSHLTIERHQHMALAGAAAGQRASSVANPGEGTGGTTCVSGIQQLCIQG
jgi:hypothetical protein